MMRTWMRTGGVMLAVSLFSVPAAAQVVHSLHVGGGAFLPRGFDTRIEGDVLVENLSIEEPLLFDVNDFRGGQVFGEWQVGFGDHVEAAVGVGFYQRTVNSVYANLINDNGSEIEQDLKLRIVPVTALVRFLPFGRPGEVQPYVGAGISLLNWRYSESGEFVDLADFAVFRDRFNTTGSNAAPVVMGGVRVPIDGDIFGLTLEWRHQWGEGNTGGLENGFLADKIDLSGSTLNIGFIIRY